MTPLTLRAKLEIAAVLLTLAGAWFVFTTWRQEHDDRLRAEASVDAQKKAFDAAAASMAALRASDVEREKQTAATVDALQRAAGQAVTPAQIAAWLPKQGSLPQPITIQLPAGAASNPGAVATASIPMADLPALRDTVEKCQECSVRLASAQDGLTSRDSQLKQAGAALSAVEAERDAYRTELKGGTFWQRFRRRAKDILLIGAPIGAVAAAGAICGTGHCK